MHTEFRRDQRIKRVRLFLKNKNNIKEKIIKIGII